MTSSMSQETSGVMVESSSREYWEERWVNGDSGFHRQYRHPKFVKHINKLVNGREKLKFLFPLCGKTVDMKWMYDEGHTVVGVETSVIGIEEFFRENDVAYVAESVPKINGLVYKSLDNRLRLYCSNIFEFSPNLEKDFEAIFDSGSLVAINKEDRVQYANLMVSLMAPDARYMLLTSDYDGRKYSGTPHTFSLEDLDALFGSQCNMELVTVEDDLEQMRAWGIEIIHANERVQLLTLK